MSIPVIAIAIRIAWMTLEWPLVRKHRRAPAINLDRRSGMLWDAANGVELIGLILGFLGFGHWNGSVTAWAGLLILTMGATIRLVAVRTLGKWFTYVVVIRGDHRLVREGPYRHLRHPAYTGSLLAHAGLGLAFSSWISLTLSTVPFIVATLYRIKVEERALQEAFGEQYAAYRDTTKRLIPWVY